MKRKRIAKVLEELLAAEPSQDKRQLLAGLRQRGLAGLTTTDVNSVLYEYRATFTPDGETPPLWRLLAPSEVPAISSGGTLTLPMTAEQPRCYQGALPRGWQSEALASWQANHRRGVVEAVTGTGKTTVGVLAAAAAIDAGEKVLVLVPTTELLHQWHAVLLRDLGIGGVGLSGDGHAAGFSTHDIVVSTVHTAARYQMLPPRTAGLLIADEVHRYGAETFARALEPEFRARLGLTATYSREDNGLVEHLAPYFGPVVAGCDYERGLADGILARFRVGFMGTDFTADERLRHDEYDERAKTLRRRLIADHGCPDEPFGAFMGSVVQLSRGGNDDSRRTRDARGYLNAFSKRRQLMADCRRKHEALTTLAPLRPCALAGRR